MKIKKLALASALAVLGVSGLYYFHGTLSAVKSTPSEVINVSEDSAHPVNESAILAHATDMNPEALKAAVSAYEWSFKHGGVKNPNVLTIVDLTKPSYEKRLWVVDVRSGDVLMNLYTTQGKNSGLISATSFSNQSGSDESSSGVYETLDAYQGKHGTSLRLQGLEKGVNDNAFNRAVVIHAAPYAAPDYIAANHRAGRSWGCFAIDPAVSTKLVNLTKGGSVLFSYAPAENNHAHSVRV